MVFIEYDLGVYNPLKSVSSKTGLAIGLGTTAAIVGGAYYWKKHRNGNSLSEYVSTSTSSEFIASSQGLDENCNETHELIIDRSAYPLLDSGTLKNDTLLAECLDEDIYNELRELKTKFGSTIDDCIQVGVDNPNGDPSDQRTSCGIVAADAECYKLFEKLFSPIVAMRHEKMPIQSFGNAIYENFKSRFVSTVEIRVHRNLSSIPFAPRISRHGRRYVYNEMIKMCCEIMQGAETYLLADIDSDDHIDLLRRLNLLYDDAEINNPYRICIGQYRDRMDARAVVLSSDHSSAILINSLDHLIFIGRDTNGDLAKAYEIIQSTMEKSARWLNREGFQFAYDEKFGYLTVLPEILGSATIVKCRIAAPAMRNVKGKLMFDYRKWFSDTQLVVKGIGDDAKAGKIVYDVETVETFFNGENEFDAKSAVLHMMEYLKKATGMLFPSQ